MMLTRERVKSLNRQERLEYFSKHNYIISSYVGHVEMYMLKEMLSVQSSDIYTHSLLIKIIHKDADHVEDFVKIFSEYINPYTIGVFRACCKQRRINEQYIRSFFDRILEDNNGHIESDKLIYLSYPHLSIELVDYMYDHITVVSNIHDWSFIVNSSNEKIRTPSITVVIGLMERSGILDNDESIQIFISYNCLHCRKEIVEYVVEKYEDDLFNNELGTRICHLAINYNFTNFSLLYPKIDKSLAYVPDVCGKTLAVDVKPNYYNIHNHVIQWLSIKSKNPYF